MNNKKNLVIFQQYSFLFYLITISAYQLNEGFDDIIVKVAYSIFMFSILLNGKIIINNQILWSFIFWGYYFLSLFWTNDSKNTLMLLPAALQIISIFFSIPILLKKIKIEKIMKFIILGVLYSFILMLIRTPIEMWGKTRFGHIIGLSPNELGMRAAISALFGLYFFHKKDKKVLCSFLMILFAIIVFLSGSRKAFIMLLLGLLMYEILITKGLKVFFKIIQITFLLLILIAIIFNNQYFYQILGSRIESLINTAFYGDKTDHSYIERSYYINQAINLFKESPIIGIGGNNFRYYMEKIGYSHVTYSHNNYVEILSTLGIIGFLIYYYFLIKITILLFKKFLNNKSDITLLFFIIMFIKIFMDWGYVSYYSIFDMILLAIANFICCDENISKSEKSKEDEF